MWSIRGNLGPSIGKLILCCRHTPYYAAIRNNKLDVHIAIERNLKTVFRGGKVRKNKR